MLTAGLNALALMRFGGFHLLHGGGRGGFAGLLIGLAIVGVVVWAIARPRQSETVKN